MSPFDKWKDCAPGVFPECGCHYTTDDDGVHFCPLHQAAPDLLAACKAMACFIAAARFGRPITMGEKEWDNVKTVIAKAEGAKS